MDSATGPLYWVFPAKQPDPNDAEFLRALDKIAQDWEKEQRRSRNNVHDAKKGM